MKTNKVTMAANFNRGFEIEMSIAQAESGSHQGPCDADVAILVADLADQLDSLDPEDIRAELAETGAWDEEELKDEAQNRHRIVWQAACNIKEEWRGLDAPIRALALHLECSPHDISEESYTHYDMPIYSAEGGEYAVATDAQADSAWDQSLDSYIEECIEPELEKLQNNTGNLAAYVKFDEEMWKRDARMDGRGHSLSGYDGHEHDQEVDGETFYIYRTN